MTQRHFCSVTPAAKSEDTMEVRYLHTSASHDGVRNIQHVHVSRPVLCVVQMQLSSRC